MEKKKRVYYKENKSTFLTSIRLSRMFQGQRYIRVFVGQKEDQFDPPPPGLLPLLLLWYL